MPLSDIVTVNISATAPAFQQAGFGVPMILDDHTHNTDLIRYYTTLAGMVSDGFATTEPAYLAASEILQQTPQLPKFAVGRRALRVTRQWDATITAQDSTNYTLVINGNTVTVASGVGATANSIITLFVTAITALAITGLTASNQGAGTSLRLVMTVGTPLRVAVPDAMTAPVALISMQQTNVDPGVATDLAAILVVDQGWYAVTLTSASTAEVLAAAAWIEANLKLLVQNTQDGRDLTAPSTGIMGQLSALSYRRSPCLYHGDNYSMAGAAWLGARLSFSPGSENWRFANLVGVTPSSLTATQTTNLLAHKGSYYSSIAGVNMVIGGTSPQGQYVDITRGIDWLQSIMQNRVAVLLSTASQTQAKIPYTDAGIAQVQGEVLAALDQGIQTGFLAGSPKPTCTVPLAKNISPTDRQNRVLNNVSFQAQAAGAINLCNIVGNLTF